MLKIILLYYVYAFSNQYLAPEVLRKQPYDNTVDWWCLGSVLYEMLFGLVSIPQLTYAIEIGGLVDFGSQRFSKLNHCFMAK